jgi:hypothetical protein
LFKSLPSYLQVILKSVLGPRPKLLESTCQFWPLAPICQIKRHGEGQKKEVYYVTWAYCRKKAPQLILSPLWDIEVSFRFK